MSRVLTIGAGTAVLAAMAPAIAAGRAPVVASLSGRRPAPLRAALPTAAGLLLLLAGVLLCVLSLRQGFPELWIAFSALPTVVGAVLLTAGVAFHGVASAHRPSGPGGSDTWTVVLNHTALRWGAYGAVVAGVALVVRGRNLRRR